MYICLECHQIFEEAERHQEPHGEKTELCPYCGNDFTEANQCKECGEYFADNGDIYNGYCYECAKAQFDLEAGLRFLSVKQLEGEYFLNNDVHCTCVKISDRSPYRKNLIQELKNNFLWEIEKDGYLGLANDYWADLMEFCLNDWTGWVDFLIMTAEESSDNAHRKAS